MSSVRLLKTSIYGGQLKNQLPQPFQAKFLTLIIHHQKNHFQFSVCYNFIEKTGIKTKYYVKKSQRLTDYRH